MTLGNFANSSYSPLYQFIKSDFLLDSAQLGLITSSIFIGSLVMSSLTGFFVDRLGKNSAIKISFGMMALGSFIAGAAQNYPEVISGFFTIGFGYGIVTPSTNSAIMEEYYPHHSRVMGVKQSGVPLGGALAAVAFPLLVLHISLHGSLFVLAIIMAVIALLVRKDSRKQADFKIGKGYIGDFLKAWRNRSLIMASIPVAFFSWGQQSLLTYYVLYVRWGGFSVIVSGSLLALLYIGSITGRLTWISLNDVLFRSNRHLMLALVMVISGLLFMAFSRHGTSVIILGILTFMLGMSAVGWNSIYVTLVSEIAPRDKIGLFSGVSLMMISLGSILGTPASGLIIDFTSYSLMWLVLGVSLLAMALGLVIIQRVYRTPGKAGMATKL